MKKPILWAALLLLPAATAWADGTETLGPPSIPIASGTGLAVAGVGLEDSQPRNINVAVPAGASVEQVILYWGGDNGSVSDLTPTDTIQVGGNAVTGAFIGGNTNYSPGFNTVSYRADITGLGLVQSGANSFSDQRRRRRRHL